MVRYDSKTKKYSKVDTGKPDAYISVEDNKPGKASGPIIYHYIDLDSIENGNDDDENIIDYKPAAKKELRHTEYDKEIIFKDLRLTKQNYNYLNLISEIDNTNIVQYINDLIFTDIYDRFDEVRNNNLKSSSKTDNEIEVYTLKEISEILKVTNRTLLTYIKNGKLKAAKIGGKWIVTKEELENLINN